MNAQEAIERMEIYLQELNRKRNTMWTEIAGGDSKALEDFNKLDKDVVALSIVLESAKLLHEHTVPDLKRDNLRFGQSEEYKTIYGIPLEKVGIELDKEEGADHE